MRITEQNTEKMSDRDFARYRDELLSQLSNTVEYLHRANLEAWRRANLEGNSRFEDCIYITIRDIRDECARNGINI